MRVPAPVITAMIGARLAGGLAAMRLARPTSLPSRLADIPTEGVPVSRPVTIHWNDHHIPVVEADTDADAAIGLGIVHAHLRLAQMEVMRRLAHGRLAEMLGPAALPLDHGLRLLDFPRAVAAILTRMPAWTRAWIEAFAAGLSHVAAHAPPPPEFSALGLAREPWTAADVLAVGRLAAADVNWIILFNMLRLRDRDDWPALWAELVGHDGANFAPLEEESSLLGRVATVAARAGSNAIAVAGSRTAGGAALMAADPHLTLTLPNLWLAAGVRCPSLHAAGLMIPGLPFIAIGRNPAVAWSGTSLQAASTDLFDATGLPAAARRQEFRARWNGGEERELRDTRLGPLVSDCRMLGAGDALALKWMGHRPSDELTAWLRVAAARDWDAFAAAADGMAVPGQSLVYADRTGRIGKLIAAHLPRRPDAPPRDCVLAAEEDGPWRTLVSAAGLPQVVDPPGGIVVSANERPHAPPVRVGSFFPGHDRYLRLHRLARRGARLGLDDLAEVQRDVFSETALDLRTWLALHLGDHPVVERLEEWDGRYVEGSRGAAALELMLDHLHRHAGDGDGMDTYWASWNPTAVMRRRLEAGDPAELARAVANAADAVPADLPAWGAIHRLRLGHGLGLLPGLERLARFTDLPAPGGNDTVYKTAHGLAHGRHGARFGANARFLADLADPDDTHVVLLGGQDGWPGSSTFLDQVPLWRRGETIALPLRPETVRAAFPYRTVLRP